MSDNGGEIRIYLCDTCGMPIDVMHITDINTPHWAPLTNFAGTELEFIPELKNLIELRGAKRLILKDVGRNTFGSLSGERLFILCEECLNLAAEKRINRRDCTNLPVYLLAKLEYE